VDLRRLTLAAIGVVYGDIGVPALRRSRVLPRRAPPHHGERARHLLLVFWALILVVVVKYLLRHARTTTARRCSLLALSQRQGSTPARALHRVPGRTRGTALYGDGMITPAISVLSAIEA
jgi:KUP system potassium uptake protein